MLTAHVHAVTRVWQVNKIHFNTNHDKNPLPSKTTFSPLMWSSISFQLYKVCIITSAIPLPFLESLSGSIQTTHNAAKFAKCYCTGYKTVPFHKYPWSWYKIDPTLLYKVPSTEPDYILLACLLSKLAYLSMLFLKRSNLLAKWATSRVKGMFK